MKATQNQMVLPLLEVLEGNGGRAATPDLYDAIAEKLDIPLSIRTARKDVGKAHEINTFEREVRWAQQRAKLMGLVEPVDKPYWRMTGKGQNALNEATPGIVVTIFTTDKGVALWGSCEDAVGYLDDNSVNLIFSSPPYPLLRKKQYGNINEGQYVDWLLRCAEHWPDKLCKDGSLVLNLADVYLPGTPTVSLYQEKLLIRLQEALGFKLCQRFAWQNPSKMGAAEWVNVRRVRVKTSLENIFWLSNSDSPFADNRQVLTPYSASMQSRIAQGGEKGADRPSGYNLRPGAFGADNGGSIPGNLIVAANTESNSSYIRLCKENNLPVHPARFPKALASFFIRFLTRTNDLVFDPFGGSNTTAEEAEKLGRRWITSEVMRDYVLGAKYRFAPNMI